MCSSLASGDEASTLHDVSGSMSVKRKLVAAPTLNAAAMAQAVNMLQVSPVLLHASTRYTHHQPFHASLGSDTGCLYDIVTADGRPRAQKRVTLEEAYGSSSQEDGGALPAGPDEGDIASSASEMDVKGLEQVPDSDASSNASLASEAESPSPPAKRKVCLGRPPSLIYMPVNTIESCALNHLGNYFQMELTLG